MIHQALYGYENGHDLLATSLVLSREQRIILSQLTDLSGPEPVAGFDGYLSGYPLPRGLYALSRTWYATELPRPGCVWTHSILLGKKALNVPNLFELTKLFRRPKLGLETQGYSVEIGLPAPSDTPGSLATSELASIIDAVYSEPALRICIPTDAGANLEDLFLRIWNQQWPSLRSTFSFTTGMLGGGTQQFDLQGIPSRNVRLFRDSGVFRIHNIAPTEAVAAWAIKSGTEAASASHHKPFEKFLWTFGDHFKNGRGAFKHLAETFEVVSYQSGYEAARSVYELIRSARSTDLENVDLCQALFGGTISDWSIAEVDALEVIARDEPVGFFDVSELNLEKRCRAMELNELEAVVLNLSDVSQYNRTRQITRVFVDRCSPAQAAKLPLPILLDALKLRPKLGREAEIWDRREDEAVTLLTDIINDNAFNCDTAYGLLSNGSQRLLYEARDASSDAWISAIREYTEQGLFDAGIEDFMLDRLCAAPEAVRQELAGGSFATFLKFAAVALDLSILEASSFPLDNAATTLRLPHLQNRSAELRASTFLLFVSLVRTESRSSILMREGFVPTYLAAQQQELPWDLWKRLESQLPWHWLEWDHCARMIEGAVERFADNEWSASDFLETFRTEAVFDRAIDLLKSPRRRVYLQNLTKAALTSDGPATSFQVSRLSQLSRA